MLLRERRLLPSLLRQRAFRRFWTGQTVSMVGDQIMLLALPLTAVLFLHANAPQMGYLTAVGVLPNLLFALPIGAYVDRHGHYRRTMITSDLAQAALLCAIPLLVLADRLNLPVLYAIAFGLGVFEVFFAVSDNTLFTAMVEPKDYVQGNALLNGSRAVAGVGGQSAGGLLVAALTAPVAILANAASYLVSAFFLARIKPVEPVPEPVEHGHLSAGWRFIRSSPVVRTCLAAFATVNLFTFVFQAIFVLYATTRLHVTPAQLGLVLGAGAIGAVLGAAITSWLTRKLGLGLTLTISCVVFPAPLALVPLAGGPTPVILAMLFVVEFVSGIGVMMLDIAAGAIQQASVPDRLRARVSGAFRMVNYGTRPLGAVAGGLLGSAIGLPATLWVAAIGATCCVLWLLPSPIPRQREFPHVD